MARVVSLFSGCGGLDLGFKWSGFDVVWAIDNSETACQVYEKNVGREIACGDIQSVDYDDVPDCDVIIGGPPCQAFSLVGKRDAMDGNFSLVWEFLRGVKEKSPHAFVMENVPGLRSAVDRNGRKILPVLIKSFERLGYTVAAHVVNAADYGVPQRRKRLVLIGSRGKNSISLVPKTHSGDHDEIKLFNFKKWVSAREALDDLPKPPQEDFPLRYTKSPGSEFGMWVRNESRAVQNHWMPTMSELDREIISHIPEGGNYMDVPDHIPSRRIKNFKITGGRTTTYGRLDRKMPAYTINTYFSRLNVGCNIHYSQDRLITIREGLRLQSFRDDFVLPNSLSKRAQYSVVGNAVPPLLAFALAESLRSQLLEIRPSRRRIRSPWNMN